MGSGRAAAKKGRRFFQDKSGSKEGFPGPTDNGPAYNSAMVVSAHKGPSTISY